MNQEVQNMAESAVVSDGFLARQAKEWGQKESANATIDANATDHEKRFRSVLWSAGVKKTKSVFDDEIGSNVIERLLWKRVLKARFKLMQDCVLLREGSWANDQISFLDLEADVEKHSQALQDFQATREFYSGIGKLSPAEDKNLIQLAATNVAALELEKQADADGDDNRRIFISRIRSRLAEDEKTLLDNPKWLTFGKRNPESTELRTFGNRLIMGVFGGLSLLVPMMIMVLSPTKLTNLITTIVFVLFVAVALATTMGKADAKDVFAAVAAYTAVLVVFVGTNTTSEGESNRVAGAIGGGVLGGMLVLMGAFFGTFYPLFLKREDKKRREVEGVFEGKSER